jgi:hypothetical protein
MKSSRNTGARPRRHVRGFIPDKGRAFGINIVIVDRTQ